jgi:hypothetical protein
MITLGKDILLDKKLTDVEIKNGISTLFKTGKDSILIWYNYEDLITKKDGKVLCMINNLVHGDFIQHLSIDGTAESDFGSLDDVMHFLSNYWNVDISYDGEGDFGYMNHLIKKDGTLEKIILYEYAGETENSTVYKIDSVHPFDYKG